MAAGPRHKDETFEDYRARLKHEGFVESVKYAGWWTRKEKPRAEKISPEPRKVLTNESRKGANETDF